MVSRALETNCSEKPIKKAIGEPWFSGLTLKMHIFSR
jgi:hypothetical protein